MKITNIKWDTDGDEEVFATLPQEIDVPAYFLEKKNFEVDGEYSRDEMLDQLSDWLSDEYGFCHGGFDVEQEADMQYQLYARYGKKDNVWHSLGLFQKRKEAEKNQKKHNPDWLYRVAPYYGKIIYADLPPAYELWPRMCG